MNRFSYTLKACPIVTAVTIGLCYLTTVASKWFGVALADQANVDFVRDIAFRAFDNAESLWRFAAVFVQLAILMPAAEELLFRGLLLAFPIWLVRTILKSRKIPQFITAKILLVLVSSALFVAAHYLAQPWPDNAFVALFFFALAQCWLYRKTRSFLCIILNHSLFNVFNLLLLLVT